MKILISGASGFIGSVASPFLKAEDHEVWHLVRREPGANEVYWDPDRGAIDKERLEGFDGVVHLASMSWSGRWTPEFKQRARDNRVRTNGLIARTLAGCKNKPAVVVCASGQGIYPSSGDEVLTEDSPIGNSFLAELQCEGEAATAPASAAGIRVTHLRIPMVVGVPNIQRGMGRAGSGRQWTSWVARDELASIIEHALVNDRLVGPINAVSPRPLRNAEFAAILNRVLGKPNLYLPAFVIRWMMGEMGEEFMLSSRRIEPRRLLDSGYLFRFPELEDALRHELAGGANRTIGT